MTDKEFTEKALFDIEHKRSQEWEVQHGNKEAQKYSTYADEHSQEAQEAQQKESSWRSRTDPIRSMSYALSHAGNTPLSQSANKVLDDLVKNGLSAQDMADIRAGKTPKVDLDGSKKTLFGRLKNKVRNFLRPETPKNVLETKIAEFKIAMAKNPNMISDVKDRASLNRGEDKGTFKGIADIQKRVHEDNRSTKFYHQDNAERLSAHVDKLTQKAQTAEKNLEAINAERDKAAKKIELKAQARENLGITNNEQGIDALAARADAMKNMTPEQRLAFRVSQLRGTAKEQPKAKVVQMNQPQKDQSLVFKKLNEGRA